MRGAGMGCLGVEEDVQWGCGEQAWGVCCAPAAPPALLARHQALLPACRPARPHYLMACTASPRLTSRHPPFIPPPPSPALRAAPAGSWRCCWPPSRPRAWCGPRAGPPGWQTSWRGWAGAPRPAGCRCHRRWSEAEWLRSLEGARAAAAAARPVRPCWQAMEGGMAGAGGRCSAAPHVTAPSDSGLRWRRLCSWRWYRAGVDWARRDVINATYPTARLSPFVCAQQLLPVLLQPLEDGQAWHQLCGSCGFQYVLLGHVGCQL